MISLRRLRLLWGLSAVRDALLVVWGWGLLGAGLALLGMTLHIGAWMTLGASLGGLMLSLHPALRSMPSFLRFLSRRHPPLEDRLLTRWELARTATPAFFLHRLDQEIQARLDVRRLLPPTRGRWIGVGLALTLLEGFAFARLPARMERLWPPVPREMLAWSPPRPVVGETLRVLRSAEPAPPLKLNGLPLDAGEGDRPLQAYRIPLVRPGTLALQGTLHRVRLPVLPRPRAEGVVLRLVPPASLPLQPVERPWGGTAWLVEGGRVILRIHRSDTLEGAVQSWDGTWTFRCPCADTLALSPPRADTVLRLMVQWYGRTWSFPPTRIRLLPDRPPVIRYLGPTLVDLSRDSVLPIQARFSDDFGLQAARWLRQTSSAWRSLQRWPLQGRQDSLKERWILNPDALAPGDTVTYRLEVQDLAGHRTLGPQVRVFLPDLQRLLEAALLPEEASPLETPDSSLDRTLNELEEALLTRPGLNPQEQARLEGVLQREEQILRRLEQRTRQTARALEWMARQTDLPPEVQQELQQIARILQEDLPDVLREALRSVQRSLQQKSPRKEALRQSLEQLKEANELLRRQTRAFRNLLERLATWRRMERAAATLDSLAREQLHLASRTLHHPLPSDSLQKAQADLQRTLEEVSRSLPDSLRPASLPEARQAMQQSQHALQQAQRQRAMRAQQRAYEAMKQAARELQKQRERAQMQAVRMDMEALARLRRQTLSLLTLATPDAATALSEGLRRAVDQALQDNGMLLLLILSPYLRIQQARKVLDEGHYPEPVRGQLTLAVLELLLTEQEMQQQAGQQGGSMQQQLEQMLRQMLQRLRQGTATMEGMAPLPLPVPGAAQQLAQALARELEEALRQLRQLQEALGKSSGTRDALQGLQQQLEANLKKLREGTLTRQDVERQKQTLQKFLRALRAMKERGLDLKRVAEPPKPYTPAFPPERVPDPFWNALQEALQRLNQPGALPSWYRAYLEALLQWNPGPSTGP
jgi:hypothetical protein